MKENKASKQHISDLQKKIDGFSANQGELTEKSRFKASGYMKEINQREEELGRFRAHLVTAQEENKLLTVTREKIRQQNEFLARDLKSMEEQYNLQKLKVEE
jgi:hypothetical protein